MVEHMPGENEVRLVLLLLLLLLLLLCMLDDDTDEIIVLDELDDAELVLWLLLLFAFAFVFALNHDLILFFKLKPLCERVCGLF